MKLFPTLTAGALALAISSPAFAAEVEWKMTAAIGEGSFLYQNFMERFADNVGMITQDRVNIQPFGAGVLAPAFKLHPNLHQN